MNFKIANVELGEPQVKSAISTFNRLSNVLRVADIMEPIELRLDINAKLLDAMVAIDGLARFEEQWIGRFGGLIGCRC